MYGQHTERLQKRRRRRKKQETKPITNTKLYWRESLVGNGITRAFNWMEVTFAEQGVAAFVSARRHKLLPYTCIMLHWIGRGRRENSQSHSAEFSLTSQLMGGLWRHRGAARGEKKNRSIDLHVLNCQFLKTFLTINHTQMSTEPWINLNAYLSAPDLSAFCACIKDKTEEAACDYKSSFSSVIKL